MLSNNVAFKATRNSLLEQAPVNFRLDDSASSVCGAGRVDHVRLVRLCQSPQFIRETLSGDDDNNEWARIDNGTIQAAEEYGRYGHCP